LGVQCGRVKVVYFTPRLYMGVRAELLVRTHSGIVYLGHLCAGESDQFRPLIFLDPVWSGAVFRWTRDRFSDFMSLDVLDFQPDC